MASNRHHPVVDLTDDYDVSSTKRSPSSPLTYVPSAQNPAKRSRIDFTTNENPLSLLNPRGYLGNGSIPSSRNDIQSFPSGDQEERDRTAITFNKRMENLHGLKDRKIKSPDTSQELKRGDIVESQDRHSGNSILSKNVVNGSGSGHVIDLTGLFPYKGSFTDL